MSGPLDPLDLLDREILPCAGTVGMVRVWSEGGEQLTVACQHGRFATFLSDSDRVSLGGARAEMVAVEQLAAQHAEKAALAIVARIAELHPHADRLDVLKLDIGPLRNWPQVVTGRHYRAGELGVWIRPGCRIPGWLARDLWVSSKDWFRVSTLTLQGEESAGMFAGRFYAVDRDDPSSVERKKRQLKAGDREMPDGRLEWRVWRPGWEIGQDVTSYIGVVAQ